VRGNVGVQVQRTDQSSSANYWDATRPAGQNVRPFENGKSYTDVLPSLNLAFSLSHDQTVRVAAARQLARARVDQMRASLEFGVNTATGEPGASGGNPELDPWRANAFDISYEKYFNGTKGYVAAAAFYKDLRSYIYNQTRDGYDFSSFVADYVPPVGSPPALTTGRFTAPYNGQGGNMQGLELTASLPLELLWAPLEGFGIIASASFTDSSITIPPDSSQVSSVGSSNIKLPGLSDEVYNLTAYYTHGGFEARVSNRRRSDFIGEIGNFAGERQLRYVVGEDVTDAQVSYSFDGALKGVSLLLQAYNLTNSTYQTYSQSKDRPLENVEWGRTYLVGVSYKF
jgi:TonB-dependent receptor